MAPRLDEAVRSARAGDPRAFRILTDHLAPPLLRFLTGLLGGDTHAAHDAAQETFLRAWGAREDFHDLEHLRRWCYRVARCKAVSWIRRRTPPGRRMVSIERPRPHGDDDAPAWAVAERAPDEEDAAPHRTAEEEERLDALFRAMEDLPPGYRGPVTLHYLQGHSTHETARLLGLRRNTVKMRLHRARRYLRRAIAEDLVQRAGRREAARRARRMTP